MELLSTWSLTLLALVATPPASTAACEPEILGEGVTLAETTPVAEIAARGDELAGRAVAVAGRVREVCQAAGCWLELEASDGEHTVRVKVEDGVIVFPLWARGKAARAEGTVERLELTREQYVGVLAHEAAESGEAFDPAAVAGEGTFRHYRIRGTGAEICR